MSTKPVGVRFDADTLERLHTLADTSMNHGSVGSVVRELVGIGLSAVDGVILPELMGTTEAAAELGTTTSNLGKIAGLPEPLYGPRHEDPRRRVRAGSLYDAAAIRALATTRRAHRGSLIESVN